VNRGVELLLADLLVLDEDVAEAVRRLTMDA